MGRHRRRDRVRRVGYILRWVSAGRALRAQWPPPPASPQASRDDATGYPPQRARRGTSRPRPRRTRSGVTAGKSPHDHRSLAHTATARCSWRAPGSTHRRQVFLTSLSPELFTVRAGLSDIRVMSETPEPGAPSPSAATAASPPPSPQEKSSRLFRAAAWVVIVAGIVFIVAVVFFAGMVIGHGKCHHHRHHQHGMSKFVGPDFPGAGGGWQFRFRGPGAPGTGPGFPGGPGSPPVGPPSGPAQTPQTPSPSVSPVRP